jgi:TRAP-type uncharacterized transport system fused permease subunit
MAHARAAEGHRPCFLPPLTSPSDSIPLNSTLGSTLVALLPLALLLVLLAIMRVTAWLAPAIAGTWILVSLLVILAALRVRERNSQRR